MARRATVIKAERGDNKGIVLALDAGSSLSGDWVSLKSQGRVMVEGMNAMGYDAMALGRMDFALGLEALKEREAEADFAFLSANVVGVGDGQPIFEPYTLLERQGARIGVIGLSEPEAIRVPGVTDEVVVLDPLEAARRHVPELRDRVDLLIVLSHVGLEQDIALAQAVPGINVIVGGYTRKLMKQPERVGNTLIVQQGYLGEWLGRLQVTFDGEGVPTEFSETIITLDPRVTDDKDMTDLVQKWKALYPSPTPRPTRTPDPTLTASTKK